jgi:hypothetical protein
MMNSTKTGAGLKIANIRVSFQNRRYRKAIDHNNRPLLITLIVDKFVFYWTFVMSCQKCEQVQIS